MTDFLDTTEFDNQELGDVIAWVESLGLDPSLYRATFAITHDEAGHHLRLQRQPVPQPVDEVVPDLMTDPDAIVIDLDGEVPAFLVALCTRFRNPTYRAYMLGARDAFTAVSGHLPGCKAIDDARESIRKYAARTYGAAA